MLTNGSRVGTICLTHLFVYPQKLPGNHDTYTPQKNILSHPLVGVQLIRIVPSSNYQRMTCLRFELYGCSHDHTLPVAYAMQNGVKESSLGDLRDLTYDGRHDFYDYLTGGIGQLVDGNRGDDNYKVNYGYEWIGWRSEGDRELSIIFRFATVVNFTSVTFYAHNLLSKDIQVCLTCWVVCSTPINNRICLGC